MTLYESTQIMNNKIIIMYNKLYTLLNKYNVNISRNNTFTELIEKVDTIPGAQYYYKNNNKPISNVVFNESDSLLRKEINIYYKIQYLCDYLKYALLVKGVPKGRINECETLNELIDLIDFIDNVKTTILNIDVESTTYYYNSYINLPYTLLDSDNDKIYDGDIIVLEDNIEIARIIPGEELKFLPSEMGTYHYSIYYSGTDDILPSEKYDYIFKIIPPALRLSVDGKNIGESQYKNHKHILYDEDTFQLTITTINPHIDLPLINVPFVVTVPQINGDKQYQGITDSNGICTIDIQSDKIDTFNISIKTTDNNDNYSNASTTYNIIVYHNPIKINDYIFYTDQNNKDMEIKCYDNQGELTNNYYTSSYKIIQKYNNQDYHNYNLNNKSNPFVINETHNENGRYNYTYQLYQNNNLICTTTNKVKIKRNITIELIPTNKFLTQNTENIQVYIYVTDYLGNPVPNTSLKLTDTYHGIRNTTYVTNDEGIAIAEISVKDILTNPCNGFLLQAIILEENNQDVCQIVSDDYSNATYYRINNQDLLDTLINIKAQDTYGVETLSFNVTLTMYDSEGERVLRPISTLNLLPSPNISTMNTINIIDGSYANIDLDNSTYESIIGDNLNLIAKYNGETNHYNNTSNNKLITFVKSNVVISTTLPLFEVYSESEIVLTLTIPNANSKFITGDVDVIIDNDTYSTTRNKNVYTVSIIPLSVKESQLLINYKGNKYTNENNINYSISIDKTKKYNLTCDLNNDEIYIFESLTFTPHLVGTTTATQTFNGSITYTFSNGYTTTKNLSSFTYTPPKAGSYSVTITYNGDNNHYSKSITKTFVVKKITPTLSLSVPSVDAMYDNNIDYKTSQISYNGNDEGLTVKVYDNNTEKYNKTNIEHDENIFNITSKGTHNIKLKTDETDIYNSLTLEKNIETYDFLEELYKILQDINDEENYTDKYSVATKTQKLFESIINNDNNYDKDTLEGFYSVLNHLEE